MYVCSTNWLKITIKHSSDIFFCNFPLFFPSASKTLKTVLPQSNRKSFSKKNKLFLHFSSLLQLLLLEPYHHYHPNVPNLNYYAKKQKKKNKFFSVSVNQKKCEKGSIFFSNRDFSKNVFF